MQCFHSKDFFTLCNLCFLFLVLFLVRISQAAFLPDFLSNSDILIYTKKQLRLQILTNKTVRLQLTTISCSCNFNYCILQINAIPGFQTHFALRTFRAMAIKLIPR